MSAKPIATLDLETDPFEFGTYPKPFAGCFFDGRVSEVSWSPACCIDLIDRACKFPGYIYAHNGGKFDLHFLLPALLNKFSSDLLEPICIGARMVAIKTPVCEFRDSYALIPKALKSFSDKKEIDINKLHRDVRESNRAEIIEYLKQDCIGLYDALQQFFDLYGINLTLASTTFSVAKKLFGIEAPKTGKGYDETFRPYYFAGRVQFWQLGEVKGPLNIVDINSAFPYAMLSKHWFTPDFAGPLKSWPKEHAEQSFYNVTCDSNAALPKRMDDKSVGFPICRNTQFFASGWELLAGMELGLVSNVRIHEAYEPLGLRNFSDYVNHFYHLKKHAENEAERNLAKLFLNSYYGKYAIDPREFRDVRITKWEDDPPKGWSHSYDDEGRGLSFYQRPAYGKHTAKPMRFYNVCTASSVTSFVRAYLLRAMASCGSVLYCDTDSIIARDTSKIKLGAELGEWKLEKECESVFIGGKKLYAAKGTDGKWKTASKGVRLTADQIVKVALGEAQTYQFDAPNYSVFSPQRFTRRTVRRDDQRKRRKVAA